MTIFNTDSPISGASDAPDRLNRSEFARRVAKSLVLDPGSSALVVSLEGPWGSGKTSVINLIHRCFEMAETESNPIVFSFNPWMTGNAENLVQEFLVQFGTAVGLSSKTKSSQGAAKKLIAYGKIFDVMKWVPGAEPWAGIVEKVITGVGTATEKIAELKTLSITATRDSLVGALASLKRSIVVFIDDLDRLPPNEVFQMIRAIKAISDFPRTTYVLAFEREYIERSLKYNGIRDARSYLDKVIQVRLDLPIVSEKDLHSLSVAELQSLSSESLTTFFEGDQERLSEIYHLQVKPIVRTPRELKRIFNRLRFVEPALRMNVCFSDTYALEVLAIKAPHVYEHIRSAPWAYNGEEPQTEYSLESPEEVIKKYEDDRRKVLETVPKEDRVYAKELISKLFPRLDSFGGSGDLDRSYSLGRIASPDRLRFALTFGLPSGEVASNAVLDFVKHPDSRDKIIKSILEGELLERFIELLIRTIRMQNPPDSSGFISVIGKLSGHGQVKILQGIPRDMLKAGPIRQLWWITERILQALPQEDRIKEILALAKDPAAISLSAFALNHCLRQYGVYDQKDRVEENLRWMDEPRLEDAKRFWVESFKEVVEQGSFGQVTDSRIVLLMMHTLDPEGVKDAVKSMIRDDSGLDAFAEAIGKSGQDSNKGEYSEVKESFLAWFGDIEYIRRRVQTRLESPIEWTGLKAIYDSILTGEERYLSDNSKKERF